MEQDVEKQMSSNGFHGVAPQLNILMVEDNPGDVRIVTELINSSGIDFNLTHAIDLKETFALCMDNDFDIILLDLGLPGSTGLETLKLVQVFKIKSPIVVMTGLDDEDIALAALREGAQDYLVKSRLTTDNIIRSIKYAIERKKIQELLNRHTRQFSLLSTATGAISRSEDIPTIFSIACENFECLVDRSKTVVLEFNEPCTFRFLCTDWLQPFSENIRKKTGLDLANPVFTFPDECKGLLMLLNDGRLHEIKGGFFELFGGLFSQTECSWFEELIGTSRIWATGFMKGEKFYGGALIFTQKVLDEDDINIIETISAQASLSIHRRLIEKELRLSEFRLRSLSKELEMKVRERTNDLEYANIRLQQELNERTLAQEALRRSEVQLKELIATKDKFFNILAHDLKNPFTSMLGSSELLYQNIQQMSPDNIRRLALILNDSAKGGYSILLNLLDWSRSQTGMLKINPEKINLKELIIENIANHQLQADNKEISLNSEVTQDLFTVTDVNMINTILRNLISNSIKFTNRGGMITIKAKMNSHTVTISVKDNGIGIPTDKIDDLFRIDNRYSILGTEKETGTGLGLKLTREFVGKMGGTIAVESIENQGTIFNVSIPIKKS